MTTAQCLFNHSPVAGLSGDAADQHDGYRGSAGVEKVYYKDESSRFGLGSFKALGGSYAIECLSQDSSSDDLVVCTATDGNHGRAVAWGASLCGAECHVFIHANVSEARAQAIASLGAVMHRVEGNYDDSIAACNEQAALHGWQVVSDTSWEGYRDIPKMIMAGYSVMTFEMMDQLHGRYRVMSSFRRVAARWRAR